MLRAEHLPSVSSVTGIPHHFSLQKSAGSSESLLSFRIPNWVEFGCAPYEKRKLWINETNPYLNSLLAKGGILAHLVNTHIIDQGITFILFDLVHGF